MMVVRDGNLPCTPSRTVAYSQTLLARNHLTQVSPTSKFCPVPDSLIVHMYIM